MTVVEILEKISANKHTQRGYREDWNRFQKWLGNVQAETVDTITIQKYIDYLKATNRGHAVRERALAALRTIYRHLVLAGELSMNPAREAINPRDNCQ